MPSRWFALVILALFPLTLAGVRKAEPRAVVMNFERDKVGEKPAGFYFDTTNDRAAGAWRVMRDEQAAAGAAGAAPGNVLVQSDRTPDAKRYALAVLDDHKFEDVRVSARIKLVAADVESGAGVVWRYRNSENHYLCRIDAKDSDVRLFRIVNGNRIKFAGEDDLKIETGRWYTLRVEHRGKRIKVYLDDEMLFDARDDRFDDAGKVGLWTQADTVAHLDDLRAEEFKKER